MTHYGKFFIPRGIFDSEIWERPHYFVKIWLWIIGNANYKEVEKGGRVYHRGEFLTTILDIIEATKWTTGWRVEKLTQNQVWRVLDFLRKIGEIATQKTTRGLFIKVLNYDYCQTLSPSESNTESNTESNRTQTAVKHYKRKKDKKDKEESAVSLRSTGSPSSLKAQPPSAASPDDREKIKEVIEFFRKACIDIKGFEPVTTKADEVMIKRYLKIMDEPGGFSVGELTDELDWFLGSELSDELGCTIKIALSAFCFNKWQAQRGIY